MSVQEHRTSLKRETDWLCVVFNLQVLISCLCSVHFIIYDAKLATTLFSLLIINLAMIGVKAGSHRLWAHHSYKANTSLRIFLMICQTLTGHTTIYNWVRLHRLHHKHFQTDLDPYYSNKGFVHSHFICNNLKLSPAQEKELEEIDMSDIENDNVVMFQKKYYWILFAIFTILLPINAPLEYWNETILNSVFIVGWLRFCFTYHLSLLTHSAIYIFDYDKQEKNQFDSNLVFFVDKSYWISYHYRVPWDYQASEYGKYGIDCISKFIRVCAALEFASDLKTISSKSVRDILHLAVSEKKDVSECISFLENNLELPDQHYLMPSKLY